MVIFFARCVFSSQVLQIANLLIANSLYLLEHSLNTMIDMQETIYGLNQHIDCLEEVAITEPLYMTPCFAFDEDCLEFSTCADIKGMKAIRLLKYDFRNRNKLFLVK